MRHSGWLVFYRDVVFDSLIVRFHERFQLLVVVQVLVRQVIRKILLWRINMALDKLCEGCTRSLGQLCKTWQAMLVCVVPQPLIDSLCNGR